MKRIMMMVALAAFMVAALSVSALSAFAISQQAECEARDGTFTNEQGKKTCTVVEEGRNPKFTQEEETSQQGRIGNKGTGPAQETSGCPESNPGNSCPGGQFND